MREVVIASAVRTPIGKFGGSLKDVSARKLGAIVIKEALNRAGVDPAMVDEVIMGCVLQGGLGQNVSRQMSLDAGVPVEVPTFTINKVCGSGLRAVELAAQIIKAGDADIVVAGGAENMSATAYAMPAARWGARMFDTKMVDMMVNDGLWDAFNGYHMGITAENVAEQWGLTREQLDEFSVISQQRAEAAVDSGRFDDEIVPVTIPQRKGDDSGAAVVVMSAEKAEELGIKPLCKIVSYASGGVDPSIMGVGPVPASKKALEKAGLTIDDIDLVEANEAFAAQSLAVRKELGLDPEKTNVNGGAIALGHPIGASGCRILVTLIYEMMKRDSKRGLATLCIGGGMGTSLIVER